MINFFLCILFYESLEILSFCCLCYGFDLILMRFGCYKMRVFFFVYGIFDSDFWIENMDLCYLMEILEKININDLVVLNFI